MAKVMGILSMEDTERLREVIDDLCKEVARITSRYTSGDDLIVKRCFADELMMEVVAEAIYRWDLHRKVFIPEVR